MSQVRGAWASWPLTGLLLLLAAAWSILSTDYQFASGDDAYQAPLVLHQANPRLLPDDPLTVEVASRYKSLLLMLLGWGARATSLPVAYAIGFVAARVLLVLAYYHFARAVTSSRTVGLVAAFLLPGMGFHSFGVALGDVPLVECRLLPRTAALPFALLALAAIIEQRQALAGAWLLLAVLFHPVTGANLIGVALVYALLDFRATAWRRFGAALAVAVVALAVMSAQWRQGLGGQLIVDRAWRGIISTSVGAYVFLLQNHVWRRFALGIVVMLLSLAAAGSARVNLISARFAVGGALAAVLHLIGVDLLGIHTLLQACPQRATFAVAALSGVAASLLVVKLWRTGSVASRVVASLLFVGIVVRLDPRYVLLLCVMAAAAAWPDGVFPLATRGRRWAVASLTGAVLAGLLCLVPSPGRSPVAGTWAALARGAEVEHLPIGRRVTDFGGLHRLATLGGLDRDEFQVQRWLRVHTLPPDRLMPPRRCPAGWQVLSLRECVFNESFATYTHLSREIAFRYEAMVDRLQQLSDPSWRAIAELARREGADWAILDARDHPWRPGDPQPSFSCGHYRVVPAAM